MSELVMKLRVELPPLLPRVRQGAPWTPARAWPGSQQLEPTSEITSPDSVISLTVLSRIFHNPLWTILIMYCTRQLVSWVISLVASKFIHNLDYLVLLFIT